jgi:hypothetical protein
MVRGSVVRITRLDAQGRVLMGPRSSLVTDGIAKMQIIQKESESQGFRQATPDGDLRIYLPAKKDPETFSTDITLTGTDPDAVELLTGNPVVTDDEGKIVGFDMTVKRSQRAAVALEVWSRLAVPVLGYRYAYTIIPFEIEAPRFSGWTWNGSLDKPTFTPSLLCNQDSPESRCHSFVTDGKIQFLSDCHHELAGQTVELPDWE